MVKYGILHCHSEHSVRDSAMSIQSLVSRAKELNAPALALTDHGILTGVIEFVKTCRKNDINPIVGIEAYFSTDGSDNEKAHLILMAKDYAGYAAISKAVRDSYAHLLRDEFPRMTYDILEKWFGPGTEGHGRVIATSACSNGVLAAILCKNDAMDNEVEKLKRKQERYAPPDDAFLDAMKADEEAAAQIEALIAKREALKTESYSTAGLKRRLRTAKEGSEEFTKLSAEIAELEEKKERATKELDRIKAEIATRKKEKSEKAKLLKKQKESVDKWLSLQEQIDALSGNAIPESVLLEEAKASAIRFRNIFGKDFYIELQNHDLPQEAYVMPLLAKLAEDLSIPVVAANDAHYATSSSDDVRARTLVAATRFNRVIDPAEETEPGYGELYIKDDAQLREALVKILPAAICDEALLNIGKIANDCNFEFPSGSHYPVFVGGNPGESAADRLRRLATEGITVRYPDSWDNAKKERMEYELSVIDKMGFSDYLCIVQDFLAYGRSLVSIYPEKIGYTIGPGRGSAAGSLVAYLVGITDIDPMEYGLLFERFLNPERVSMPDIDSDFSPDVRGLVIDYVRQKYGENAISAIITKGTFAAKGAIRAAGRVTDVPLSVVDQVCGMVAMNESISDSKQIEEACKTNPIISDLIADAKLIEGVTTQYGAHAAGIIIADSEDISDYVPLHYNTDKQQWVAQCDMVQAEAELGLLKFDFLGLKNLKIITDCIRQVYNNHGIKIDMSKIAKPFEPEVFKKIFAAGKTNAIFQFESPGMKKTLRGFKPDCFADIILLNAAYRPGPMQYIDDLTAVKHGRKKPVYIANGLKEILAPTYGYPIYQEQVMQIFNRIAGFSLGEADIIRRAMSKKKLSVLTDEKTDYYGKFIRGLMANGASKEDAEAFWTQLLDFANYAFNKSHAACYADIAYKTAWLKLHYPAEYMSSVMRLADYDEYPALVEECKSLGVQILPPDINQSDVHFSATSDGNIRFGLGDIKGIGNACDTVTEARAEGPFVSIRDIAIRVPSIKQSAYSLLIRTGAFDSFCGGNRTALLAWIDDFLDAHGKSIAKTNKLYELKNQLSEATDKKTQAKLNRSIQACEKSIAELSEIMASPIASYAEKNTEQQLEDEYTLLGYYVSGSPWDKFASAAAKVKNVTPVSELDGEGNYTLCGIIKSVRRLLRKKDSKPFASFVLFDAGGTTEITCYTQEYERLKDMIIDGNAVRVVVKARMSDYNGESVLKLNAVSMSPLQAEEKKLVYHGSSIADWIDNYGLLLSYRSDSGFNLYFHDALTGDLRKADFRVDERIVDELKSLDMVITKL